jgi:hypothetical protein
METLIIHPKNKDQLNALKAIMKALKIDFKIEKSIEKLYNPEFAAKMKRGEEDVKAGRTTKIEPTDIRNLEKTNDETKDFGQPGYVKTIRGKYATDKRR